MHSMFNTAMYNAFIVHSVISVSSSINSTQFIAWITMLTIFTWAAAAVLLPAATAIIVLSCYTL